MILIDAVYINNSGGKILLEYLIENLEKTNLQFFYLLDYRVKNNLFNIKKSNKIRYINNGWYSRLKFYYKNNIKFSLIFCFGNIPPPIKTNTKTYTYFHQFLYFEKRLNLYWLDYFKLFFKKIYLYFLKNNTNYWVVQTNEVKNKLLLNFKCIENNILVIPFYPKIIPKLHVVKLKNTFFYPSTGYVYKNHINLISAFVKFYNEYKIGELHITISNDFKDLIDVISGYQKDGYPIINHGFIDREKLFAIYFFSEYLIYPSFTESFGITILEAIDYQCSVIAADLPYTYAVCNPSLVFNPYSIDSIYKTLKKVLTIKLNKSYKTVDDEIINLMNIFKYV